MFFSPLGYSKNVHKDSDEILIVHTPELPFLPSQSPCEYQLLFTALN